ncbi:MAG: hypothetical protein ACJ8MH_06525 [Povalibacter sp.]
MRYLTRNQRRLKIFVADNPLARLLPIVGLPPRECARGGYIHYKQIAGINDAPRVFRTRAHDGLATIHRRQMLFHVAYVASDCCGIKQAFCGSPATCIHCGCRVGLRLILKLVKSPVFRGLSPHLVSTWFSNLAFIAKI